ncbi:hypothetical protein JHK82_043172 [Glycine max]|nr:hypothetical protein JHK82_043172 [Glycine max]
MKLTTKIGWVSRKLFEFDANVFRCFKDCFFKVLATDVVADGLPQMFNRNEEPCFPFYWQSDPTRFKLFGEDLLTLVEMIDNAILEQLWVSLDPRAILSLPLTSDPLVALDRIIGNFAWRPLVKQVIPMGGTVPLSTAAPSVGLVALVSEVTSGALSSVLAKRKQDNGVGLSGPKNLKAPMSLCA